jgi:hypothetical protein
MLVDSGVLCPHLLLHPVDTCVAARQCSSVSEATGVALYTETLCLYSLSFLIPSYHRIQSKINSAKTSSMELQEAKDPKMSHLGKNYWVHELLYSTFAS